MTRIFRLFQNFFTARYRVVSWYSATDQEFYIAQHRPSFSFFWRDCSLPFATIEEARSAARKHMLPPPRSKVICYVDPARETVETDFTRD